MKTVRQVMRFAGALALAAMMIGCKPDVQTADVNVFEAVNATRRAEVYFKNGDIATAEKELHKALDANYENPAAHYWLGQVFEAQTYLDKAVYEYHLAVRFAPSLEIAQIALVESLNTAGRQDESLDTLENWLTHTIMQLPEYLRIGTYFQEKNMPEHAVRTWEIAAKTYPQDAEPSMRLANFYLERNMKEQEMEWLKRAGRIDPYYPGLSRRLGEINLKLDIPEPVVPTPTPAEQQLRDLEL